MTGEEASRLRSCAAAMRAASPPDGWALRLIASTLVADADALDRGETVDGLTESLELADAWTMAVETP